MDDSTGCEMHERITHQREPHVPSTGLIQKRNNGRALTRAGEATAQLPPSCEGGALGRAFAQERFVGKHGCILTRNPREQGMRRFVRSEGGCLDGVAYKRVARRQHGRRKRALSAFFRGGACTAGQALEHRDNQSYLLGPFSETSMQQSSFPHLLCDIAGQVGHEQAGAGRVSISHAAPSALAA